MGDKSESLLTRPAVRFGVARGASTARRVAVTADILNLRLHYVTLLSGGRPRSGGGQNVVQRIKFVGGIGSFALEQLFAFERRLSFGQ